jgi:hypothetical protein
VNYHQGILQATGGLLDAAQNQQLKDLLKESGALFRSTSISPKRSSKSWEAKKGEA